MPVPLAEGSKIVGPERGALLVRTMYPKTAATCVLVFYLNILTLISLKIQKDIADRYKNRRLPVSGFFKHLMNRTLLLCVVAVVFRLCRLGDKPLRHDAFFYAPKRVMAVKLKKIRC